jgi:hypothetical protein
MIARVRNVKVALTVESHLYRLLEACGVARIDQLGKREPGSSGRTAVAAEAARTARYRRDDARLGAYCAHTNDKNRKKTQSH